MDGYALPLDFVNGLAYLNIRPFTDDEWNTLPHVTMSRDVPCSPRQYDSAPSEDESWFERQDDPPPLHDWFNLHGEYLSRTACSSEIGPPGPVPILPIIINNASSIFDLNDVQSVHYGDSRPRPREYEALRRYFLNQPIDVVRHSFNATTRYHRSVSSPTRILDTRRTQYPAANTMRRHEPVATDTVFADIQAWGGATCAQIFVGRNSRFVSIHGCKSDAQFVNTLEDEIRKRGAMDTLISDRAQAEVSNRVQDILRSFVIDDWQSEPHYQHQNYSERVYQEIKKFANWVLNWSGAPPEAWLLVFKYVAFIWNRTARKTIEWRTPSEVLTGQTPDISVMLHFVFWEQCFIKNYVEPGPRFPSESNEIAVRFVGYSESVGHDLTFLVWNEETQQLLYRSRVRKIKDEGDQNRCCLPPSDPPDSPDIPQVIRSSPGYGTQTEGSTIRPDDLIGRTFLMKPKEDGTRFRAEIVGHIEDLDNEFERETERIKFKVLVGDEKFGELVDYSEMCEFIEEQAQNEDGTWRFRKISNHRTAGRKKHEVLIEWESGECTYEPISAIYAGDKYLLAEYAKDNNCSTNGKPLG